MEFLYTVTEQGVRIDRVKEPESLVVIPEEIGGGCVTELGPYVLAESRVEELHLPPALQRIGAYAFYNCEALKRIYCYSRIRDLGTGMFAGAKGAEYLDFYQFEGETSYLKDMLAELRQTLRVRLHGAWEARLIFPEYFEESVENTPARILVIQTHGCGHRYRYCFDKRAFQFGAYDELFLHVQVQESEALVTELALGRMLYPCGLTAEHEAIYRTYLKEHWELSARLMILADKKKHDLSDNLDRGLLPWFVEHYIDREAQVQKLVELARAVGSAEHVSWLMDFCHERFGPGSGRTAAEASREGGKKKRRFEL